MMALGDEDIPLTRTSSARVARVLSRLGLIYSRGEIEISRHVVCVECSCGCFPSTSREKESDLFIRPPAVDHQNAHLFTAIIDNNQ